MVQLYMSNGSYYQDMITLNLLPLEENKEIDFFGQKLELIVPESESYIELKWNDESRVKIYRSNFGRQTQKWFNAFEDGVNKLMPEILQAIKDS